MIVASIGSNGETGTKEMVECHDGEKKRVEEGEESYKVEFRLAQVVGGRHDSRVLSSFLLFSIPFWIFYDQQRVPSLPTPIPTFTTCLTIALSQSLFHDASTQSHRSSRRLPRRFNVRSLYRIISGPHQCQTQTQHRTKRYQLQSIQPDRRRHLPLQHQQQRAHQDCKISRDRKGWRSCGHQVWYRGCDPRWRVLRGFNQLR